MILCNETLTLTGFIYSKISFCTLSLVHVCRFGILCLIFTKYSRPNRGRSGGMATAAPFFTRKDRGSNPIRDVRWSVCPTYRQRRSKTEQNRYSEPSLPMLPECLPLKRFPAARLSVSLQSCNIFACGFRYARRPFACAFNIQ